MNSAIAFSKALGDPTRFRIVAALRKQELCVCELCDALELSQSTLSTHLTLLRESGLVVVRRDGKWIYYALASELLDLTARIFRHFDDVETDQRIKRDARRVQRRLTIRDAGRCISGFDQLDQRIARKRAA